MTLKKLLAFLISLFFLAMAGITAIIMMLNSELPKLITVSDYQPLLVSEVYDRSNNKIGEFTREKRQLIEFAKIPKVVVNAFLAAEDSTFFQHGGINYFAIMRAMLANLRAGEKAQGASTITQQVARSLLLSNEKTYTRKIKEMLLSYRMESHLSKEEILYLYLNQIYLGQKAYGVAMASKVYFDKDIKDISLNEAAMLAGMPKAPSAYSPLKNPKRAKERQHYVLMRMADEGMITRDEAKAATALPLKVFEKNDYWDKAPFFLETVRQMLIEKLGEETVSDRGIQVFTSLDEKKQQVAAEQIKLGLRDLDKRQGYRGPLKKIETSEDVASFLLEERNRLLDAVAPFKILQPDGTITAWGPLNLSGFAPLPANAPKGSKPAILPVLPSYIPPGTYTKAIVTRVDDLTGLVYVRFAETKGLIDIETMGWARKPDPNVDGKHAKPIEKPSEVLAKGDVIEIRVIDKAFSSERLDKKVAEQKKKNKKYKLPNDFPNFAEFARVELEEAPLTQGALLSIDQQTEEIIALVGGYEFGANNQLNRAIQTVRQTGSSFKPFVYLSALDKGFTPATMIADAPIVFEEETEVADSDNKDAITKKWKPMNHSNHFSGDILFRNALIQSLNVPSVKIIEKVGVPWAADYARRLGIFSPLNMDFTLALGSSSLTLYEITKGYAEIGKLGRRIRPIIIHKVLDKDGKQLLGEISLDERFASDLKTLDDGFEERRKAFLELDPNPGTNAAMAPDQAKDANGQPVAAATPAQSKVPLIFFKDPDQLVRPQSAYVLTSLLQGVVEEQGGTGAAARSLGRPTAGKTGTNQGYDDAWFLGYTADIATGVWVGYDQVKSLGRGEVGGRSALPIWLGYMKAAHEGMPVRNFTTPEGIVFASIDNETGRLASANSKEVVRQAFLEGTEPKEIQDDTSTSTSTETQDFYKEDLSQ